MNLSDSPIAGRRSPPYPGGDRPVRGRRFIATSPNGSGLMVGSTSVLGLRARDDERPTIPDGFVGELQANLAEPGIGHSTGEAAVLHHPGDVKVFDHDRGVLTGQGRGELVDRIAPLASDAMVDAVAGGVGALPAIGRP